MNYEVRIKEILESSIRMAGQREKISCSFFEEYRKKNGFAKIVESDRSIYIRMYGEEPSKIGLQKIRFWRLGHHLPKNRAEALALGQALELEWDDLDTFLKEHCLMRGIEVRKNHAEMFEELFPEYLCQITDERLQQLNITPGMQEQQKCHIFYSDALDCIRMEEKSRRLCYWQHMYSRGFSGEFRKYFIKESVLSRETVMRVLILLMMPDLNVDILNGHLLELGYGELNEKRRQEGYVDAAVLGIFQLYEKMRSKDRGKDREMMKYILRQYDTLAAGMIGDAKLQRKLRFMKFRSIGNDTET